MAKLNKALSGESVPDLHSPDQGPPMPKHPANSPFMYRWHEKRWGVMKGNLVPLLDEWRVEPGLGGVDKDGAWRKAAAEMEERGWKVIPRNVQGKGTDYLTRHKVRGGYFYASKWTRVWANSDQVGSDEDGYIAFLRWLVDNGVVEEPPDYVLVAIAERMEMQLDGMKDKVHGNPSLAPEIERMEKTIAVIRAGAADELDPADALAPEPVPEMEAPKPKRRTRKKPEVTDAEEA